MINTKTLLVLTLSLAAILVLAGCGTQATAQPAATQAPPTESASVPTPQEAPTEPVAALPTESSSETPTSAPAEAPAAAVSFANDVMPILQSRCINCHGGDRTEEGLVMRTYEDILAGSKNGPVIVPGDVNNSLLVELVANQKMPKRGPKLTPPQVQLISDWVAAGALNN